MEHVPEPTPDVDLASDLVTHAARLVRAVRRDLELPAGVRVLSLLDEHGALTITQLAAEDRCSQPTMSAQVSGLVEQGWVQKSPNPDDARSSVITATDEGRAELARVRRRHGERIAALVADHPDLTTEDLAAAVTVLGAILDENSLKKGSQ
jgi:DNA-binding MarR family transcriptional regulator